MADFFIQPVGHAATQQQLATMLQGGKMPHALLLHGPRGVGKATLARWLAARLICGPANPPARNPLAPNRDSALWAQLLAGSSPDFHILSPEEGKKSIGVKAVQTLLEGLLRSSDNARVALIDCVDDFTPDAANTLLKTLEEPRPGIYFILLSHQLAGVLATIKSRCRLMRMGVLSDAECAAVLAAQGGDMDDATLAKGAPGVWLAQTAAQKSALNALRQGQMPPANVPGLLELLQHHLATLPPSYAVARTHHAITELKQKQETLNLPATLVQEQALLMMKGVLEQNDLS